MANFALTWTPAGGTNSISQRVEYKMASESNWFVATNLDSDDNSYTIQNLVDNVVYDFRIVNLCLVGGPIFGAPLHNIKITCPVINTELSYNWIKFTFANAGFDITGYKVELLNAAGTTVIATKDIVPNGGTVSDQFNGVQPVTNYNLRVTPKAVTQTATYDKVCPLLPITTLTVPTCDTPVLQTVIIS